jgi:hypothetical protein
MSGLYRLSVSIQMKDDSAPGFAAIERNAARSQAKTDALRKSLELLGKGFDPQHSLASQSKLLEYTERQVQLRKELALTTNADERSRITTELTALSLMKEQETLRKSQLTLQERLGKLQDTTAYQAQASQEKLQQQTMRNQTVVADAALRNQGLIAKAAYAAQVEQERVDLRNIKVVADAKKAALRDQVRSQASFGGGMGLLGGLAAGYAGSALLSGVRQGISSASEMQMAETTIGIATGASRKDLEGLRTLAFDIADQTAQSATDAMKNIAILASSGLNSPEQLRQLAPGIAQFADVQYYTKKTPFEESARQGVQLAHLFGALTADKMKPILEHLTQISFAMPDSLNKFLTQATYYEPVFRGLGVKNADALEAGAIMDRAGLGRGKGGTALQNLILNEMNSLALTSHVQGKRGKALHELGLTDSTGASNFYKWNVADKRNEFDILGALKQIDKSVHNMPAGLTDAQKTKWQAKKIMDVNAALGLTGERAALAINTAAIDNLDDSLRRIKGSGTMAQLQRTEMDQLWSQEKRFSSNLDSLLTDLMFPWLDDLRGGFKWMGDETHTLQAWSHQHQDAAKAVGAGLAAIGASLAIYSGVQLWGMASGLSGLSKAIKLLGASSVVSGGEMAVAEGEVATGASALGVGLGLLGKASLIFGAVAGLEYFVQHGIPSFEKYRKDHPDSGPSYIERGSSQFAAAEAAYKASQVHQSDSHDIHVHGNVVVQANDPRSLAKALISNSASATRHPVSKVNTMYSQSF